MASASSLNSEDFVVWLADSSFCLLDSSQTTHVPPSGTRSRYASFALLFSAFCLCFNQVKDSLCTTYYHYLVSSSVCFHPAILWIISNRIFNHLDWLFWEWITWKNKLVVSGLKEAPFPLKCKFLILISIQPLFGNYKHNSIISSFTENRHNFYFESKNIDMHECDYRVP